MTTGHGLTVRWSLADAPDGIEDELASYVADTSYQKFDGLAGLRFKTWRMRPGEWFEGCYVFVDDAARRAFHERFEQVAAESPGSRIIGSTPVLVEECEVEPGSRVTLLYANRTHSSVMFLEEVEDLKDLDVERVQTAVLERLDEADPAA